MNIFTRLKTPRKTIISDFIAAIVMAAATVPGSLANGLLAGVNPIYGLYSTIAGTAVAALFTSSVWDIQRMKRLRLWKLAELRLKSTSPIGM